MVAPQIINTEDYTITFNSVKIEGFQGDVIIKPTTPFANAKSGLDSSSTHVVHSNSILAELTADVQLVSSGFKIIDGFKIAQTSFVIYIGNDKIPMRFAGTGTVSNYDKYAIITNTADQDMVTVTIIVNQPKFENLV